MNNVYILSLSITFLMDTDKYTSIFLNTDVELVRE